MARGVYSIGRRNAELRSAPLRQPANQVNGVKMRFKILAYVLFLLSFSSSAAQHQPRVTGFFTDMAYIPEAGDVVGTEVWIVYARDRHYAAVQDAQGEPDPPVVVPVAVSGSQVKFSTRKPRLYQDGRPAPDEVTDYVGTVTKTGLLLSTPGSSRLLKRRNSYWQ